MGSGKLVLLLLLAGSVGAGMLAAGATTHAMRTYRAPAVQSYPDADAGHAAPSGQDYASSPQPQANRESWLDEGLSMLDIPAWPFGRDEWDGSDDTDTQDWQGRHGHANRPETPAYGHRHLADQDDAYAPPHPSSLDAGAPDTGGDSAPPIATSSNTPRDAADDAAMRAGAAAQDVLSAEKGK